MEQARESHDLKPYQIASANAKLKNLRRFMDSECLTSDDISNAIAQQDNLRRFYQDKVVFLTGASGCLGGGIMYQLIDLMEVGKIFILTRDEKDTYQKWERSMAAQVPMYKDWIAKGKLVMVRGDSTKPKLGIDVETLRTMEHSVHIIINSAANTNFDDHPKTLLKANCLPVLELQRMVEGEVPGTQKWDNLESFVHVSTAYVNAFKGEGEDIEEIVYTTNGQPFDKSMLAKAESRRAEIEKMVEKRGVKGLELKKLYNSDHYFWPYAESKHLAEQILTGRYEGKKRNWKLMIARFAIIGPALMYPHLGYGPVASNPCSAIIERLMQPDLQSKETRPAYFIGNNEGQGIVDESPSDVSTAHLLALIPSGQEGVVHLSAGLYKLRTPADVFEMHSRFMPSHWQTLMRTSTFIDQKTLDERNKIMEETGQGSPIKPCVEDLLFRVVDYDLRFLTKASYATNPGLIGLEVKRHRDGNHETNEAIRQYDYARIEGAFKRNEPQWARTLKEQSLISDAMEHLYGWINRAHVSKYTAIRPRL